MARIKTADANVERASALADAMDAARQPLHQGMKLGELIEALEGCAAGDSVYFDFGGFHPRGIDSYRGYYSDLSLSYSEDDDITVEQLLAMLKQADGATFDGYKGGKFRMDLSTPVWVANYGCSHGVAVVAVEKQSWRVLLRTALID